MLDERDQWAYARLPSSALADVAGDLADATGRQYVLRVKSLRPSWSIAFSSSGRPFTVSPDAFSRWITSHRSERSAAIWRSRFLMSRTHSRVADLAHAICT